MVAWFCGGVMVWSTDNATDMGVSQQRRIRMGGYVIGLNVLKQFLFGVGFAYKSISICFACFSVEINFANIGTTNEVVSFYNEFKED